jgi:hypothetical protein
LIPKDSTMEKMQDWMEITLSRTLLWIPIEFFGSPSSSPLTRYSKLCFAQSPYLVQRFEIPSVEHHLRSSRRHSYRSIESFGHILRTQDLGADGLHWSNRCTPPVWSVEAVQP